MQHRLKDCRLTAKVKENGRGIEVSKVELSSKNGENEEPDIVFDDIPQSKLFSAVYIRGMRRVIEALGGEFVEETI